MVSYKLVNNRFELQGSTPKDMYAFENAGATGSYDNLRDISPVMDNLVVVTSTEGLSIIYVNNGNFQTNNLTVNELQENVLAVDQIRYLYETSTASQLDNFEGIISPRFLNKGIMIYNNIDLGFISISSIENGYILSTNTLPA